ncbi:hypothetical protein GCM10025787_44820 [Saccharopolyspora rosea]
MAGPWRNGFPTYAWHRSGDSVVEFRLVGGSSGEYTGYPLHPSEWPPGVDEIPPVLPAGTGPRPAAVTADGS